MTTADGHINDEEEARCFQLRLTGLTYSAIGRVVNRTPVEIGRAIHACVSRSRKASRCEPGDTFLYELALPVKDRNALLHAGLETAWEVQDYARTHGGLRTIYHIGAKNEAHILDVLAHLPQRPPDPVDAFLAEEYAC